VGGGGGGGVLVGLGLPYGTIMEGFEDSPDVRSEI
jgi:hypothetical protein